MNIRARGIKQGNGLWAVLAMMLAMFAGSAEAAYTALTINSQPGNTTAYEGDAVKFVINATSSRSIKYYWYKNGSRVGTNSNTLRVSDVSMDNAGNFTCKVTDGNTTEYCAPFTFTVLTKPAAASDLKLNSQPGNTTAYEGDAVKFVINATSSRSIKYYWYKNGSRVGTNSDTLPVSNVTTANAGNFTCKVTDGNTTQYCTPFTFTVLTKPAATSDLKLSSQPASTSVYEGGKVTLSLNATSTRAMTYSWTKNGAVIGTGSSLAISSAQTGDAGSYGCSVSDGLQTLNCTSFALTVNKIVRITTQPVSQMLSEGANASLSVTATGTAPISYQWYYNGSAISGATSSTLSFSPTATSNSGSYYCVVRNPGSNVTSSAATLSIAAVVKTGSAMISWQAPTTRADGSALTAAKIAGYDLYHSADSANGLTKLTSLNANELNIVVDDLAVGTHYFALTTRDIDGLESTKSATFSVSIK